MQDFLTCTKHTLVHELRRGGWGGGESELKCQKQGIGGKQDEELPLSSCTVQMYPLGHHQREVLRTSIFIQRMIWFYDYDD